MKVVWLCRYSLYYLKELINIPENLLQNSHPVSWIYYMSEEIKKRKGIQLFLITTSSLIKKDIILHKNNIIFYVIKKGINIYGKDINSKFNLALLTNYYFLSKKLRRIIKTIDPDVIDSFGTEHEFSLIATKMNYPTLIHMQGLMNDIVKFEKGYFIQKKANLEQYVIRNQRYFVTLGIKHIEQMILNYNPNPIFFPINYPVANFSFKNIDVEKDCDIVYISRISKLKGIEDLLDAIKIIKRTIPKIKLKIIGLIGDKYYKFLLNKISTLQITENIIWKGFLDDHKKVLLEMKKAKIFILPTYFDSGPLSVSEAMASGLPIIAYNVDGLPSMLEHNITGLLVDKGDVKQLAINTIDLLNNIEKQKFLSINAKRIAMKKYNSKIIVDELIDAYKKILAEY